MARHNEERASISVIVPTRNRAALLDRLLTSLEGQGHRSFELLVVDDGSTDDTKQVVERHAESLPSLTYLYQRWSKMGAARNRALEVARGDILAFTDDDCVADPNWLTQLEEAFRKDPEALGVQGRTTTELEKITPFTRQIEQLTGGPPYRTCNIAYRAAILKELGGFDTKLIRGEDVVMGMRVSELGPIVFNSEALIIHPPRPKDWADRRSWRLLLDSELHFRRMYPQYGPARSPTLSIEKADHVLARWVFLPIKRYWRWHVEYGRAHPREYLSYIPLMVREKVALLSLLPFFYRRWLALPKREER